MICAGAMPCHRNVPATTRSRHFKLKQARFCLESYSERDDRSPANPARVLYALLYEFMFRVCARDYHSYSHLKLALSIVRDPILLGFNDCKILLHT